MTPACMTPDELSLWSAANRILTRRADAPCRDCPLWFAESARASGCCNGQPSTVGRLQVDDPAREHRRRQWRESSRRRYARRRTMMQSDPGPTSGRDGSRGLNASVPPAA